MVYDIPDKIRYREKIVFGLDWKQLIYAVVFGLAAFFAYSLPLKGDSKLVLPSACIVAGLGFTFLNLGEKITERAVYLKNVLLARRKNWLNDYLLPIESVDSDSIILPDGDLRAVLRVYPINFTLMDDDRKKVLISGYREFLNHLTYPVQVVVKTVNVDLGDYYAAKEEAIGKAGEVEKDIYKDTKKHELAFITENLVKEREYYLVITHHQTKDLDEALQRLKERTEIAQERLLDCGIRSWRLNSDQLWEFLGEHGVAGEAKIFSDKVCFGEDFRAVIKASGYPRKVEDGWLQPFLCKNEPYDISIHIKPSSISDTLVFLHNQIIRQTSDLIQSTAKGTPNPSLEIKLSDTKRLHDALYKGEEKLFLVSLYINNRAKTKEELESLLEKCKSYLNSMLIIPTHVKYRVLEATVSTLPLALDQLNAEREFPTTTLGATFPFLSTSSSEKKGILFAHEEDTKTPIFLDFDSLANKHFFVIGTSGSGKSYTAKYLTLQAMLSEKPRIYILDPNSEYSELCKSLGGDNIELSRNSESVINVFDLTGKDFGEKLLDLISAFDILVGGISESQKGVLNEALPLAYERVGILPEERETWGEEPPTFTHLYGVFEDLSARYKRRGDKASQDAKRSLEVLMNRVGMYKKSGFFGFLDRQTKIKLDSGMLNFDLSKLPAPVKPLMMFTVMDFLSREIRKDLQPKILLIDEGWALLRSKEAENYLLEFVKTSRKYNASVGFITQEIEDLTRSETGRSILNLASTKILMRQNASNIEEINRCVKLNQAEKDFLLGCKRGYGLLITENQRHKFFTSASPAVHKMITTNPNERETIEKSKVELREKTQVPRKKGEWYKEYELVEGLIQDAGFNEEQAGELKALGYTQLKTTLYGQGGATKFYVKKRSNERPIHSFLCLVVAYEAKKNGLDYVFKETVGMDIAVKNKGTEMLFEIETGTSIKRGKQADDKFKRVKEAYGDRYVILVTDRLLKNKYGKYGKVISRQELPEAIKSFF